jgi:hypothetical protein
MNDGMERRDFIRPDDHGAAAVAAMTNGSSWLGSSIR